MILINKRTDYKGLLVTMSTDVATPPAGVLFNVTESSTGNTYTITIDRVEDPEPLVIDFQIDPELAEVVTVDMLPDGVSITTNNLRGVFSNNQLRYVTDDGLLFSANGFDEIPLDARIYRARKDSRNSRTFSLSVNEFDYTVVIRAEFENWSQRLTDSILDRL